MKKLIQATLLIKQLLGTLVLTLIISSPALSSGIYKWVDENGKTHYGSQRPENAQVEKMKLHVPQPATQAAPEEETIEQKQDAKLKDHNTPDKANKERTVYCDNERKRLQTVESNEEIHEKDGSGKVNKISTEARNKRLAKIKANISKYCK